MYKTTHPTLIQKATTEFGQKQSHKLKCWGERERDYIHCSDSEEDEENKGESIGCSRIAVTLPSTTAIAETDERYAQSKD